MNPPAPPPGRTALEELENFLATSSSGDKARNEVLRGLRSMLWRFSTAHDSGASDDEAINLDSATADELFKAVDTELEDHCG
jgi:hypothetical protein